MIYINRTLSSNNANCNPCIFQSAIQCFKVQKLHFEIDKIDKMWYNINSWEDEPYGKKRKMEFRII